MQVSVSEAQERLPELIAAAVRGEEASIALDSTRTLTLHLEERPRKARHAGAARGMFTLTEAFDDPVPGFEEYTG